MATSYYLELASPDDLRPAVYPQDGFSIHGIGPGEGERAARLWGEVGRGFWTGRAGWNREQWRDHLGRENVSFWALIAGGADAGFFELHVEEDGDVKLEGFGLLPDYRSKGLGGPFLTSATMKAYEIGAKRIWLHTASDDHPNALPNYHKRGYRIIHEEIHSGRSY